MKKTLSILLILMMCMCAVMTSACSPLDSEEEAAIKDDVYGIYDQFRSTWKNANDIGDITDSIKDWAHENEIACQDLGNDNLMLSLDATDDYTNAPGTMLGCDISLDSAKENSQCAAIALAAVRNCDEHGPIRVLFTASKNGDHYGAKALSKKYLTMDNFISLDQWPKVRMFTGSTLTTEYTFKRKVKRVKVEGTAAYKIRIAGLEGGDSADRSRKHPNPIMTLGELLNSLNQSHIVFQLAELEGGQDPCEYAKSASMTVIVNESDAKKLEEKVLSKIDSFEEAHIDEESDLVYTCTSCAVPKSAYSDKNLTSLISLFYTAADGRFETNDEEQPAVTNIGYVRDDGTNIVIKASARAMAQDQINLVTTSYQSTAKLAEYELTSRNTFPGWPYIETNDLIERYSLATKQVDLDLKPNWTYHENECAIFYEKKPALDMICIGANMDSAQELAQSLVLYLRSFADKDN